MGVLDVRHEGLRVPVSAWWTWLSAAVHEADSYRRQMLVKRVVITGLVA